MNGQVPPQQGKSQQLIIDTQIIQYLADKNQSKSAAYLNLLRRLQDRKFLLAISEITVFENLQGLWGEKAKKAKQVLNVFVSKAVDGKVLRLASIFGGIYNAEKPPLNSIDTGDKIIAATSLLESAPVLTCNHRDFPNPYFSQMEWFQITYQVGHYKNTDDVCLYMPNLTVIRNRVNQLGK